MEKTFLILFNAAGNRCVAVTDKRYHSKGSFSTLFPPFAVKYSPFSKVSEQGVDFCMQIGAVKLFQKMVALGKNF